MLSVPSGAAGRVLGAAVAMLILSAMVLFVGRIRRRPFAFRNPYLRAMTAPRAGTLLLPPLFLGLLGLRLLMETPVAAPPEAWYSQAPKPARYDRAIRARLRVDRTLSPGLYLVRARMTGLEKRVRLRFRRQYRKKWNRKKWKRDWASGYRRKYRGKYRRAGRGRPRETGWAGWGGGSTIRRTAWKRRQYRRAKLKYRLKRRLKRRMHRRGRYGPWRLLRGRESHSFPVLLALKDRKLFPGCTLELRLFGYRAPRRPGRDARSISFSRYLKRKGASSYLRVGEKNVVSRVCGRADLRTRIRARLDDLLRERGRLKGSALEAARGIILGDSRALGRGFRDRARKLGLLHLFAASGLHLAIFYACLYWPLSRMLGKRRPAAVLAPLPVCLSYLWLLDFPVSLSRAFVFVLIFAGKSLVHRRLTITDQLSNAALVLLLILPRELASISGLLSFGAVGGILYFHRVMLEDFCRPAHGITRMLCSQLCLTISAGLFTTPVLVQAFGAHSHGGPAANFLLVPLTGLVLPLLYAALAFSGLPLISDGLWWAAGRGVETFARLTNLFSDYGLYYRYGDFLNPPVIASALLFIFLPALKRMSRRDRRRPPRFLTPTRLGILICIALLGPAGAMVTDLIRILTPLIQNDVRISF